jgi:hypothetical protein
MRKIITVIAIALLLASLLAVPAFAEDCAETVAEPAWWEFWKTIDIEGLKAWFEVEVMPHLASMSVILGVALAELIPAVRGLIKAKNAFGRVAADVDTYTKSKKEYDAHMEELKRQLIADVEKLNETVSRYESALSESEARLAAILNHLDKSANKVEKMVYVGMTNSVELVSNGAAKRIAAIEAGEDDDPADVETEEYSDGE